MAASTSLLTYLKSLGLTQAQIDSLLAQAAGDASMSENDIADAARRLIGQGNQPGTTTTVTPTPTTQPPGGATAGG